jgi:hypothetical protein
MSLVPTISFADDYYPGSGRIISRVVEAAGHCLKHRRTEENNRACKQGG